MKAKHPQSPPPTIPTTDTAPKFFTPQQISDGVKSFHKGSASGPSGFRPEHLVVTLKAAPNQAGRAETQLCRLVNVMAKGAVPASVAPHLCGARLHAGNKKDGGLRPIAVGNILRRLTSKVMARSLVDKMEGLLAPHQLGVSVRGGAEVAVHSVKEALARQPDKWVLQLDLQNAFNCVDRSIMLAEVARLLPECLPWAVTCYGSPSFLQFGQFTLTSSTGVQQGDPFASDLFALVLQPVIDAIESEVPSLDAHAWFHDDSNSVGTKEELSRVVQVVQRDGPARGLHLNLDKSSVWSPVATGPGEADPLKCGIKRVEDTGIKLLGCPVGDRALAFF